MKLACASSAYARAFERGDLTQLEFIELCARELAVDGMVLDIQHFPRTDDDYLAQVKKMATDLGLGIAAIHDSAFFTTGEAAMQIALSVALAVGSPLIAAPLGSETVMPWSDQLSRLNTATALAKATNVTLAVRNAPGTFAASVHDLKRASKEADSAWLRFGPEPGRFAAADDTTEITAKIVLLWANESDREATAAQFPNFRGYLAIDDREGTKVVQPHETSAAESS